MPEPASKAVFLSYASHDAEAVERIAVALRAAGVEVWFDQDELVGGDAWDAKIRGQIRSCALFVPVISAATQARLEGYFRLEWKLAANRSHTMAEERPFLLPVVIDATRDADGKVPAEFRSVQWTKLPAGETSAAFVGRVRELLGGPSAPVPPVAARAPQPVAAAAVSRSGVPVWVVAALGAGLLALGAFVALRPAAKEIPAASVPEKFPTPSPIAQNPQPAAVPAAAAKVSDKSIAVLPFTNMSEEKDSAFFADGVHEDILTNLALIPELKVVSRTTVSQYRDTKKTLRQVGEELGVAYILEGSVRRSANKVRVTGQLINARTDEHIWAKKYDRDVTDVFAIQASLADEIATALQAVITPEAKKQIERRPTENTAAYDAFLKARGVRAGVGLRGHLTKAEEFLQTAVDQDPKFAAAWGQLAVTHARFVFYSLDSTPERLARGEVAMANAVRLAPDDPDVMRSVGIFAYYAHRDYAKATAQLEKIARLQPNDPTVFNALGVIQRRQGRQAESLANLRKAAELDPAGGSFLDTFVQSLRALRRWDEAIAGQRRLIALRSDSARERRILADDIFWATGSRAERDEFLRRETAADPNSPRSIYHRMRAAARDDYAVFRRLDAPQPFYDGGEAGRAEQAVEWAVVHAAYGNMAAASARLADFPAEFRARLQREPSNPRVHLSLAMAEALLGRREEAVRLAEKATELLPEARDALDGARNLALAAEIFAWTGDKDRAIALLTHVMSTIGNSPVRALRENPALAPLRGDPRFEALLNDPKNNTPLF